MPSRKDSCPGCGQLKNESSVSCRECYWSNAQYHKVPCPMDCGNLKMKSAEQCRQCCDTKKQLDAGITVEGRPCSKCKEFQPWTNFHASKAKATGRTHVCKLCVKFYPKSDRFKKRNGWTEDIWNLCQIFQDGICAIEGCENPATHGDHDWQTGEPRALLCMQCNVSLGLLKENTDRIRGLLRYAEQCQNVKLTWT